MKDLSQEQFERIEAYLENRLSESDLQQFETELQQNAALVNQVNLQRQLTKSIEKVAALDFKQKLNAIHKEVIPTVDNTSEKDTSSKFWWLLLLLLPLLLGGIYWWTNSETSSTPTEESPPTAPNTDEEEEIIFAQGQPVQRKIERITYANGQPTATKNAMVNLTIFSTNQSTYHFSWPNDNQLNLYWPGERPTSDTVIELQTYADTISYLKIGDRRYTIYPTQQPQELVLKKE